MANKPTPGCPCALTDDVSQANTWSAYESGVFDAASCNETSTDIDHVVQLVGYGTDRATGLDYWLVRNSWKPSWVSARTPQAAVARCGEPLRATLWGEASCWLCCLVSTNAPG